MRRVLAAGLLVIAPLGGAACSSASRHPAALPAASSARAAKPGTPPAWLPRYTPEQLALLAPVDHAIELPSARVFPDLERFWYANNRPLVNPEDALKFTRMVATVLNDSPRFYTLDEAPPELANPVVQYGPTAPVEPDGLQITRRNERNERNENSEGGVGELVPVKGREEARAALEKGAGLAQKGDAEGAIAVYRAAIAKNAAVPGLEVALGDALAGAGKSAEADAAYRTAITVDPTFASAHLGLAALAEKRGDAAATRAAVAEALAYQPNSPRGLAMASRLGDPKGRIPPFAIFLDVDSKGAIRVATSAGGAAQMYAGCRAVMRYEPGIRARIFEEPAETPYYLSVVEEVICLEAALGAYLVEQHEADREAPGTPDAPDPTPDSTPEARLDDLFALARKEGLTGYVMFEILGMRRPERARVAPPEVHRAVLRYIEQQVLGRKEIPDGVYNAGSGWGPRARPLGLAQRDAHGHD